jgi:hypothetical protein
MARLFQHLKDERSHGDTNDPFPFFEPERAQNADNPRRPMALMVAAQKNKAGIRVVFVRHEDLPSYQWWTALRNLITVSTPTNDGRPIRAASRGQGAEHAGRFSTEIVRPKLTGTAPRDRAARLRDKKRPAVESQRGEFGKRIWETYMNAGDQCRHRDYRAKKWPLSHIVCEAPFDRSDGLRAQEKPRDASGASLCQFGKHLPDMTTRRSDRKRWTWQCHLGCEARQRRAGGCAAKKCPACLRGTSGASDT